MAAYTSKQYTNSPNSFVGPHPGNMMAFYWEISVSAAATAADTFTFGKVPKGFRALGGAVEATDMEAGTGLTLNIGDAAAANRLFAASTVAQAATDSVDTAVTGTHYLYTEDTVITGAFGGSVATGATGTLYLSLYGRFEGPNS